MDFEIKPANTGYGKKEATGSGYGEAQKSQVSFQEIKRRLNPDWSKIRTNARLFKTGIDSLDELLGGGLPYGLTMIYGPGKVGKSLLAREISKNHKSLYVACEASSDPPSREKFPNVDIADYTNPKFRPNYEKAIDQLFCFIENLKPEITIIDSMTSFLQQSRMALPESALREATGIIHQMSEGKYPIIGLSEVRGVGYNQTTAGGEGIKHACTLLIKLDHAYIDSDYMADRYNLPVNTSVYTFRAMGDKLGLVSTNTYAVKFSVNGYEFIELGKHI